MLKLQKNILILLSSTFFLLECCKEKEKEVPNPCNGIPTSTAEFDALEDVEFIPIDSAKKWLLNKDTLIGNKQLLLYPKDTSADEYTWQIDNKVYPTTKGNQKEKLFNFDYTVSGNLKITLQTKKKKNIYSCYPNDDSIKTYSRDFYLYPYNKMVFLDTWVGKYDGDNETSEVTVRIKKNSLDAYFDIDIIGFPKTCDSLYTKISQYLVSQSSFSTYNFNLQLDSEITHVDGCNFICCENEFLRIDGRVINRDSIIISSKQFRFLGKRKK